MWVRSQNRELLIDVTRIMFREEGDGEFSISSPVDKDGGWNLGYYSDGDQAIGIMDEIQERINEGCPFAYQMPRDINEEE